MDKVISLFNHTEKSSKDHPDELRYPFIIIDSASSENIFALSPHVMKVDDTTYIMDLSDTYNYWLSVTKNNSACIISKVIELEIPSNTLSIFCEHPFKGLILYNYFKERGAKGSYNTYLPFTDKIFKNVSWSYWVKASQQIYDCFEEGRLLNKERANFSAALSQFERFLKRLQIDKISELEQAHFYEIKRRFKSFIGLLFKWTFPEKIDKKLLEKNLFNYKKNTTLFDFPWIAFTPFTPPCVKNNLEYPLSCWQQIEPFLTNDLEKLADFEVLKSPNKISSLTWEITLFDISKVETEICFRHPLSLEDDRNDFFSALLSQFRTIFEKYQHTLKEKVKETDLDNVPIIIAWNIEISRIVTFSHKTQSLFKELQEIEDHVKNIKSFQNKIEAEISIFQVNDIQIPALDYSQIEIQATAKNDTSELERENHRRFLLKPLFIYNQPVSLEIKDIKYKRYLERTASPWWQSNNLDDCFRDYHICEKKDGQLVWAYKDYKGHWFTHGLYS